MTPSILIADDHPLILKGLEDFLEENNYNVVASAKNGRDAFDLIKTLQPDIAILDIQMPYLTGLEVAKKCQTLDIKTKIALITFEKDQNIYQQALDCDIYGYILKEFALDEIEHCIKAINEGNPYFSSELSDSIQSAEPSEKLTALRISEVKVLQLIAQDKTTKEIACILNISARTVEKHKSVARTKLNLDSKPLSLYAFAKKYEAFF